MYIKRQAEEQIKYLSKHFPVVVVTGARQTGKTTIVKRLMLENENLKYVTLDHPRIRELAKTDPEIFLSRYTPPVIIDEIQYAPELFPYIKMMVDNDRTSGQFYLTGSQLFRLMKNVSESLAGRVGLITLYSLSKSEILGLEGKPFLPNDGNVEIKYRETVISVFEKIIRGGMPQLISDLELTEDTYFGEYLQTYIERDVRELVNIQNELKFMKFISCVAARTGQEQNLADISRDVEIDIKTADKWMSLLVTSGLVFLLQPYSGNTIKRIVKRPKIYFMDTGLASYLSLWNNPRALEQSSMAGAMFETYVISEIIKSYTNKGIDVRSRFAYYRDNNGKEIDLLIMENGKIYPIEIKKSADPGKSAIKNFSVLSSFNKEVGEGAVICMSSEQYPIDKNISVIPVSTI